MSDRVLYYPYITVPPEPWFIQATLYWDQVGCIFPPAYDPASHGATRRADSRSRFTFDLFRYGLVVAQDPEEATESESFVSTFLALVDAFDGPTRGAWSDARESTAIPVHRGKLGHELVRSLQERGLAAPAASEPDPWCLVEAETAATYVAYLAAFLGARHEMDPITDEASSLEAFLKLPSSTSGTALPRPIDVRLELIEDILPTPIAVSLLEIANFKEDHHDELRRFRRNVEEKLLLVCAYPPDQRIAALESTKALLADELDDLEGRMTERGWNLRRNGLALVGAFGAAGLAVARHDIPDSILALAGLTAALQAARQDPARTRDQYEPLAYAALARQSFAVRHP